MTKQIKPLLACEEPLDDVKFPVYVSTKLDGIRCLIIDGVAYSRSLKPIRINTSSQLSVMKNTMVLMAN